MLLAHCCLNILFEYIERLGADQGLTIDQKAGSAADAQSLSRLGFFLYKRGIFSRIQAFVEGLLIQSQFSGKAL